TLTPTITPSVTPSPTPTPSATPSPTLTPSVTPTLTPTGTPTSPPAPVWLDYGDSFSGVLESSGSFVEFMFEGAADDVIRLELNADWRPDVTVFNPDAAVLVTDEANALPALRLPEEGMYSVRVQGEGGAFDLALNVLVRGAEAGAAQTPLAYEDTRYGLITGDRFGARYTFEGHRGDIISLEMTGLTDNLDPYLMLLDPKGDLIALNDDRLGGQGSDARIERFALPESGVYSVMAMRFLGENGFTTGAYALSLVLEGDAPALASDQNRVLRYGETVGGAISDDAPVYQFSFEGQANDVVTVTLSRLDGDLDAYLALSDFYGYELASNDDAQDAGVETDARIESLRLPVTGIYTIIATRYQRELGTTQGRFQLALERAEPARPPADGVQLSLAYGEQVSGAITDAMPRVEYRFSGQAGDAIVIDLRRQNPADTLDAYLLLEDARGKQLAFNDDALDEQGLSTTDARIAGFRLPADGEYVIVATRFLEESGTSQGAFTLSLALVEP
ncbi:MAG: pre-peptidase C-terminal domain-containing protein, partial [Anaerolineae bacterium]|nr:pre-peptidase C-terminal domain-containing protein [Anaerolineae bacterium]